MPSYQLDRLSVETRLIYFLDMRLFDRLDWIYALDPLQALWSLTSPAVFEKLSIEHRLFTSCVYQLGSVLAKHVVANAVDFQSTTTLEDFFNHHVSLTT